ncbi:hypothetical protein, partial [Escherichia coli]|uniref:hypothetical protein n=1 Tax=Escherichia coli TaxID=562 RepID=UPI001A7E12D5
KLIFCHTPICSLQAAVVLQVLIVNIVYVDNFDIKKNHQVYEQIQISLAIEKENTSLGICTKVNIFFVIKYKTLYKHLMFCA